MHAPPVRWFRKLFRGGELDCADVNSLSSDYVDGTLNDSVSSNFRRHLDSCENCNSFYATFRATVLTLKDLSHRQPPVDLQDRVQGRIKQEADPDDQEQQRST